MSDGTRMCGLCRSKNADDGAIIHQDECAVKAQERMGPTLERAKLVGGIAVKGARR